MTGTAHQSPPAPNSAGEFAPPSAPKQTYYEAPPANIQEKRRVLQELDALEVEWGAALDALPPDDLAALADTSLYSSGGRDSFAFAFYLRCRRSKENTPDRFVRPRLLRQLAVERRNAEQAGENESASGEVPF